MGNVDTKGMIPIKYHKENCSCFNLLQTILKNKNKKTNHIAETYHMLNSKYLDGLHFILAGDTNDLKLWTPS